MTNEEQQQLKDIAEAMSVNLDRATLLHAVAQDEHGVKVARGLAKHLAEAKNDAKFFTFNTGVAVPPLAVTQYLAKPTMNGLATGAVKLLSGGAQKAFAAVSSRFAGKATVQAVEKGSVHATQAAAGKIATVAVKPVAKAGAKGAAAAGATAAKASFITVAGKVVKPAALLAVGVVGGEYVISRFADNSNKTDVFDKVYADCATPCNGAPLCLAACSLAAADAANAAYPQTDSPFEAIGRAIPWVACGLVVVVALHVYFRHRERNALGGLAKRIASSSN